MEDINERDLISMKLLHYLITKKNYSPIIVQGVENEIWLQNLNENYKVIRIVNNYIHNDEQLDFDIFKTKRMVKKIKRKTFSLNMKTLTILLDIGENVDINRNLKDIDIINIKTNKDLENNNLLHKEFLNLKENLEYNEEGFQLFLKITTDINDKNKRDAINTEELIKPKKPIITIILLSIIIFVFLYVNVITQDDKYILFFGNIRQMIRLGEYYRLLTSTLLHADIIHLLCNCYSLYILGSMSESYYGKIKYPIILIISAIGASLLSISMYDGFSIGASGAIFGIIGSLLYFGYNYRVYFGNFLLKRIASITILNLIIGFMSTGIDNFAHIGGLIAGILISKTLGVTKNESKQDKIFGLIMTLIYFAFIAYLALFANTI